MKVSGKPDDAHISTSYVETPEPDHADVPASVYAPHQYILKEDQEPRE